MAMLSMPVCGVESRNEVAAARLAPWRRNEATTGITPQEQSVSGTPKSVAFSTGRKPRPPKCRSTNSGKMQTERMPAARKPNSRYGGHLAQHEPAFPSNLQNAEGDLFNHLYHFSRCGRQARKRGQGSVGRGQRAGVQRAEGRGQGLMVGG